MSDDGNGREQAPPGGFDGNEATVEVDGMVVFRERARPSRIKQLDPETFAQIIAATGLPAAPGAEHHRRNLFMAVVPLVNALEPFCATQSAAAMREMAASAKKLQVMCKQYVRADAPLRSTQPPFFLIGQLDHLEHWARQMEQSAKKPRGQPRNPEIDRALVDVHRTYVAIFATDGPDGRMAASGLRFNRFLRACLWTIGGVKVGQDWLRDRQRKKPGSNSKKSD